MVPPSSEPAYTPPWWLGGEEVCTVCLQVYVLEVEVRCVDCDEPRCPFCECARCGSKGEGETEKDAP